MKKHFKYLILLTLTLMVSTVLVYAQPINIGQTVQLAPFESNPQANTNDGMNPASQAMMYDGQLGTSGYIYTTHPTAGTAYFELHTFTQPATPSFDPGWVEIKIKYEAVATTDDQYRIEYTVGAASWVPLQADVSGSAAAFSVGIRPWSQVSEPNDGTWTWSDIANLRVRFFATRQPPGPFPPGVWDNKLISIYEVWVTVYPLPLPPTSSTTMSVLPVGVMGVKPYDAMLYPTGPQGYCFVEVYVNDVSDLYGYQFVLYFDTNVLTPTGDYFSYYPWTIEGPGEIRDDLGYVSLSFEYGWTVPVGGAFYGNSPITRIYFTVDNYGGGGGGGAYGGLIGTCDLTISTTETFLSDSEGVAISYTAYDGWFSGPRFMSYQGSLLPPGDPTETVWHEEYPDFSREWVLTSWEDNPHGTADGNLSPSDQIDMTDETGYTYWFHVEEVTVTIHYTFKDAEGVPIEGEIGSAEPYVETIPTEEPSIPSPAGSYWHQLYPDYCRWFMISSIEDTDGDGNLDISEQFWIYYFDTGLSVEAHLDDITTDIVISQKPIEPEPPVPEFPLGIGLIMAIAPMIPVIYLWRKRSK